MNETTLERILSKDRLAPYLTKHDGNFKKAINHYKANIRISESFYSVIAIIEVGLRNNIDNQLKSRFKYKRVVGHFRKLRVKVQAN